MRSNPRLWGRPPRCPRQGRIAAQHVSQVRFWRPKRPHLQKKDMPFGNPPHDGTNNCGLFKNKVYFYPLRVKKWYFWSKKRCLGVFWTECEVADLKQRQRTTAMDHKNKIQSLVLPTDDPGDAPDCIAEYGPCTCKYGRMCHTAPTAQKCGFPLKPTLHLVLLVRPEPS